MAISEDIASRLTMRDIALQRIGAGQWNKIARLLRQVERDIVRKLKDVDPSGPSRHAFRVRRLELLQKEVQGILRDGYNGINRTMRGDMRDMAGSEAASIASTVNRTVGVDLFTIGLSDDTLISLADDVLILGAPANEWWQGQARGTLDAYTREMRQGIATQESLSDLIRRIRGTRERGFRDGIMQTTRNSAERMARTSVQSVANATRDAMFRANGDVLRGVQALAVLDTRTSDICIARSGSSWNVQTGRPLPESPRQEPYPGAPPWHWRCRTSLIPVVKSFEDMLGSKGTALDEQLRRAGPGMQASMNGQVSGDLTFGDVLPTWTEEEQIEALGRGKWTLWKEGKLTLPDMLDQNGRPLTVAELEEAA